MTANQQVPQNVFESYQKERELRAKINSARTNKDRRLATCEFNDFINSSNSSSFLIFEHANGDQSKYNAIKDALFEMA